MQNCKLWLIHKTASAKMSYKVLTDCLSCLDCLELFCHICISICCIQYVKSNYVSLISVKVILHFQFLFKGMTILCLMRDVRNLFHFYEECLLLMIPFDFNLICGGVL